MIKPLDYFSALVLQDDAIPLFEAALALAQDDDPLLDLAAVQAEVDALGAKLRQRLAPDASAVARLRLLNQFFYRELGFTGNVNHYYDPHNSYLQRVLATRRGIPISLAVLYMELAQHVDLDIKGVGFPGHFLMKLSVPSGDIIIDPLDGSSLSREELEERLTPFLTQHADSAPIPLAVHLQTATPRAILARMLHNLKAIFMAQELWQKVLEVQQRLVVLLPDAVGERRDRGLAYAHLECPQAALDDLESYLARRPNADDAVVLRDMLPTLRDASRRLN